MNLSANRSDGDSSRSISFEVIAAVADREGVDPTEIEPPEYEALYDVLDPESLDSLFAPRHNGAERATGHVEFRYCGYDVTVTDGGDVSLEE